MKICSVRLLICATYDQDPVYDSLFQSGGNPVAKKSPAVTSSTVKKASLSTNIDDFSFMFGGDLIIK